MASLVKSVQRSWVWEHYTKEQHGLTEMINGVETVVGHTTRAQCKYCTTHLACDSTKLGTSTLAKHLELYCTEYGGSLKCVHVNGQSHVIRNKDGTVAVQPWTQQACIDAATKMIVMDEQPFSAIERPSFKMFCEVVVPAFIIPSRRTIFRNFMHMYKVKKEELRKELRTHSICLTTDTWTSLQNINYMVLTAHFIDNGWKMHKRVLNFCPIGDHQGHTIGKALEECLKSWGIENLLTISVDNASANKVVMDYVRKRFVSQGKKLLCGGKYLHVRCLAHIVNLIVKAGLAVMDRSVASIRNVVRYVRSSSSRLDVFKFCVEKEELEVKKVCVLDVPTRWNSTYLMLETALELKNAFDRMAEEEEAKYLKYFTEKEDVEDQLEEEWDRPVGTKRVGPPSGCDWENAEVFVQFLKVFFDATFRVSATLEPTAPRAFHDVAAIYAQIEELYNKPVSMLSHGTDKVLHDMAVKMRLKYQKYFGQLDDMNQLFLIALVLDPRYKLTNFCRICRIGLNYDDAAVKKKQAEVKDLLVTLTDLYSTSSNSLAASQSGQRSERTTSKSVISSRKKTKFTGKMAEFEEDWNKQLEDVDSVVVSNEVDRYLLDGLVKPQKPDEFCLLTWWKVNGCKYPILQAIAKDVLAIQVSTVDSESCFSTGKRVIDPHRSSLTPRSVEGLICLQNWLRADCITNLAYVPTPEEMQLIQEWEIELEKEEREKREEIQKNEALLKNSRSVKKARVPN